MYCRRHQHLTQHHNSWTSLSPTQPQSPGNINGYLPEAMLKWPQEPSAEGKTSRRAIHQSSARDPPALTGSGRQLGGRCPHTPLLLSATSLQHRPCAREPSGRHTRSIFCHLGIQHPFNLFQIPHYYVSSRLQALAYSKSCIASQILPIRQTKTPRKVRKVELRTFHGDLLEVNLRSSFTNTEFMKAPAQKGHSKVWASHPASSSSPFRAVLPPKAHPWSRLLLSQVTQQKANYS